MKGFFKKHVQGAKKEEEYVKMSQSSTIILIMVETPILINSLNLLKMWFRHD